MDYNKVVADLKKIMTDAFHQIMIQGIKSKSHKTVNDLLTDTDILMDNFICSRLNSLYPEIDLLTEELHQDTNLKEYTFVVDPIDGTCNFANNLHLSGIQAALFHNSICILSVIYMPYQKEYYHAIINQGAYLNDERISINQEIKHTEGILSLSDFYSNITIPIGKQFDLVKKLQGEFLKTRLFGAACIDFTNLAMSKTQAYICYYSQLWDIAPGLLIFTEAGGCSSSLDDNKYSYGMPCLIAANNTESLVIIRQAYQSLG